MAVGVKSMLVIAVMVAEVVAAPGLMRVMIHFVKLASVWFICVCQKWRLRMPGGARRLKLV